MSSFFYIFIFSYSIGLVNIDFIKKNEPRFILNFFKGFVVLAFVKIYLNTGLALLTSLVGVTLGHTWPVTEKFNEKDSKPVIFGSYSIFSPVTTAISLIFYASINRYTKNDKLSVLTVSFILPMALIALNKPDSSVLASIFIFFILMMQYLPYINNTNNGKWFLKRKILLKILASFFILSIIILLFFNRYVYKGFGMQIDIIRNGPRELKYVALTFDDGPDSVYTPRILDILKEKDIRATFFLIGTNAQKHPEIVQRMFEDGHSIGNHTYSHRSLVPLSNRGVYNEIMKGEEAIRQITGEKPTLFRPPRGVYTQYARDLLKEQRYTMVLWDVSSRDWEEIRYSHITNYVLKSVQPGSIILFHDSGDIITAFGGNRYNTVRALPNIIDRLQEDGYEFLTIDEMLILSGLSETEDKDEYIEDY
jgi:peptidoglycan/xylan/chitin deacetylase (PgdA/CDA1 family)